VDLGDRDTASVVYQELLPLADLWVCARADSPWNGPVRLHLGRLALLLGDLDDATFQVTRRSACPKAHTHCPLSLSPTLSWPK